jgi:hypothetical protein
MFSDKNFASGMFLPIKILSITQGYW